MVSIDVMRLGSQSGRVSCFWTTEDGSGKAGNRYHANEGELIFEAGEIRQTVEVGICQTSQWAATLEFRLLLSEPEGCELGAYLHTCRVKVIDADTFPTSKYPQVAAGKEAIESIGALPLFGEYCKMNFGVEGIAWRTCVCLLLDQMKNLYIFYKLSAMAYMLNVVFHEVKANPSFTVDDRVDVALLIGAGYIIPMAALHVWDLVRTKMDISGHSRCFLQTSIVRKYLNYNEQSRSEVSITEIQLAVREDSADMAEGYMAVLSILKLIGKLTVMLYFTLQENPSALTTVIIMPALMVVWGYIRNASLASASEKPDEMGAQILAYVGDMATNYRLIANYQQRPKINEMFAAKVNAWQSAVFAPHAVRINNEYFTQWLGPIFVGIYIITQARNVLTGALGHGTFVATLSVFGEISGDFSEGYQEMMKISSIACGLQGVTELLNRKTDLMNWKNVNRSRREDTKKARTAVMAEHKDDDVAYPTDLIPFKFTDMQYQFDTQGDEGDDGDNGDNGDEDWQLRDVNFSVPQGSIVAILRGAKHGSGRQTFLRLIAHELFPTKGKVFIPTHLRILHVTQESLILNMGLLDNLNFGVGSRFEGLTRVKEILKLLSIPQKLIDQVHRDLGNDEEISIGIGSDDDTEAQSNCCGATAEETADGEPDTAWMSNISYTERAKIHLARAFIMNPEVLILQRPLLHYSGTAQDNICKLIREHVSNRGYGLDPATKSMRRPRTVFVSVESGEDAKEINADMTWEMEELVNADGTKGPSATVVKYVDKEQPNGVNMAMKTSLSQTRLESRPMSSSPTFLSSLGNTQPRVLSNKMTF